MVKKVEIGILWTLYGKLLTEKQSEIIDNYYNEDLTLSEIAENNNITNLLVMIRKHLLSSKKGRNILRYFLVKPDNKVIKTQLCDYPNNYISYLYLVNQSIPFDSMPYAMSLFNHNISWIHLIGAVDIEGRNFELLGRYIKNNCEN